MPCVTCKAEGRLAVMPGKQLMEPACSLVDSEAVQLSKQDFVVHRQQCDRCSICIAQRLQGRAAVSITGQRSVPETASNAGVVHISVRHAYQTSYLHTSCLRQSLRIHLPDWNVATPWIHAHARPRYAWRYMYTNREPQEGFCKPIPFHE